MENFTSWIKINFKYLSKIFLVSFLILTVLFSFRNIVIANPVSDVSKMQSLINKYRDSHGLGNLRLNNKLAAAANDKSNSQILIGTIEHSDPINLYTIKFGYDGSLVSELLSEGYPNESSIFSHWKNSASHNELLLDPRFCEFGYTLVSNSKQGKDLYIATLYLGAPTGGCLTSSQSSLSISSITGTVTAESSVTTSKQSSQPINIITTSTPNNTIISTVNTTTEYEAMEDKLISSSNNTSVASVTIQTSQSRNVSSNNTSLVSISKSLETGITSENSTTISQIEIVTEGDISKTTEHKNNLYGIGQIVLFISIIGLSLVQVHKIILSTFIDKFFVL